MEIYSIGYNHPHDRSFVIDRPMGCGQWLFLIIKTPALFRINGEETAVKKNSFILFSPNVPQYYRASGSEYIDDWFHFYMNEDDVALVSSLEIPLNTVVPLGDVSELSPIVRSMTYEFCAGGDFRTDMNELYFKMLMLKLCEHLRKGHASHGADSAYFPRMQNLRNDIYLMPENDWSIEKMASTLAMSRSGFQHTYSKLFGTSPMNDVTESRIRKAKNLLRSSSMTLSEIAEKCGYGSEAYLMRRFKTVCGKTPTEYRNIG